MRGEIGRGDHRGFIVILCKVKGPGGVDTGRRLFGTLRLVRFITINNNLSYFNSVKV